MRDAGQQTEYFRREKWCVCVTYVQDRDYDGLVETRLYLGVTSRRSFRTYTVVAENDVAVTTKLVQLIRGT